MGMCLMGRWEGWWANAGTGHFVGERAGGRERLERAEKARSAPCNSRDFTRGWQAEERERDLGAGGHGVWFSLAGLDEA